jgi:hypothetical protein
VIAFLFAISIAIQCACSHHALQMQKLMPGFSLLEQIVIGCPIENAGLA